MDEVPVVIVGAGPTGLTLANLLGVHGVPVLLLERNATTVTEPRAVSIDDEALRTMQAAGLAGAVLSQVVPGYGSLYYTPRGRCFLQVKPTAMPSGYPKRNAFRQPILERQLREGLARFPHVTAAFRHTLLGFRQEAGGVVASVQGPEGAPREVACRYLVGCDGASSAVRRALDVPLVGSSFRERWLVLDLLDAATDMRDTEIFCDSRRPCITLPGPHGTRRYEFKLHAGEREEDLLAPEAVARLLAARGAPPGATVARTVVYTFHARVAARWMDGRVLLAGDAAHLTPPFAGQGMNSGLRDAQNLAWKLAWVLRGAAGPGLLASYEAERRHHAWQMIRLALAMGRIMAPRTRAGAAAMQSAFRLAGLVPSLRDYLGQMKFRPPPRFRRGFLLGGGRRGLAGRQFPQAPVVTEAGERVLLDEVLGPGFACVVYTGQPGRAFADGAGATWERLGVTRVALAARGATGTAGAGIRTVHDADGALAPLLGRFAERPIVLRPDRYVAACLPPRRSSEAAQALERLLAATWPPGQAPGTPPPRDVLG